MTAVPAQKVTVADLDALLLTMEAKEKEIKALVEGHEAALSLLNKELTRLKTQGTHFLRELNRTAYIGTNGAISLKTYWSQKMPETLEEKLKLFEWMKEKEIFNTYATVNAQSLKALALAERAVAVKAGADPLTWSLPGLSPPTFFEDCKFAAAKVKTKLE